VPLECFACPSVRIVVIRAHCVESYDGIGITSSRTLRFCSAWCVGVYILGDCSAGDCAVRSGECSCGDENQLPILRFSLAVIESLQVIIQGESQRQNKHACARTALAKIRLALTKTT